MNQKTEDFLKDYCNRWPYTTHYEDMKYALLTEKNDFISNDCDLTL